MRGKNILFVFTTRSHTSHSFMLASIAYAFHLHGWNVHYYHTLPTHKHGRQTKKELRGLIFPKPMFKWYDGMSFLKPMYPYQATRCNLVFYMEVTPSLHRIVSFRSYRTVLFMYMDDPKSLLYRKDKESSMILITDASILTGNRNVYNRSFTSKYAEKYLYTVSIGYLRSIISNCYPVKKNLIAIDIKTFPENQRKNLIKTVALANQIGYNYEIVSDDYRTFAERPQNKTCLDFIEVAKKAKILITGSDFVQTNHLLPIAMACGCLIIKVGNKYAVHLNKGNHIQVDADPKSIHAAMIKFILNPSDYEDVISEGRYYFEITQDLMKNTGNIIEQCMSHTVMHNVRKPYILKYKRKAKQ